jgi:hypothetical protein
MMMNTANLYFIKSYKICMLFVFIISLLLNQAWWFMTILPAFGRARQEDCEFQARLGCIAIPCLKKVAFIFESRKILAYKY